jgi:hypothetical protein
MRRAAALAFAVDGDLLAVLRLLRLFGCVA